MLPDPERQFETAMDDASVILEIVLAHVEGVPVLARKAAEHAVTWLDEAVKLLAESERWDDRDDAMVARFLGELS